MKISTIIFPSRDGKVWLSLKKIRFGAGHLNGYGGKFDSDKDIDVDDTAVREFNEESGAETTREGIEKTAVIDFYEDGVHIFECHIYFCHTWKGEFKESEEMASPEGYELEQVPYDQMWPGDRIWLPLVFSGQKIRGSCYYNKGNTKLLEFSHQPLTPPSESGIR